MLPLQVVEEEMVAVEEAMVAEAAPETEAEVKVKDKQVGYLLKWFPYVVCVSPQELTCKCCYFLKYFTSRINSS